MAKPRNRFEVQVVFESGAYWREASRSDPPLTRLEIAGCLEEMALRIRESELKIKARKAEGQVNG